MVTKSDNELIEELKNCKVLEKLTKLLQNPDCHPFLLLFILNALAEYLSNNYSKDNISRTKAYETFLEYVSDETLEKLQRNQSEDVYNKIVYIVETFFTSRIDQEMN